MAASPLRLSTAALRRWCATGLRSSRRHTHAPSLLPGHQHLTLSSLFRSPCSRSFVSTSSPSSFSRSKAASTSPSSASSSSSTPPPQPPSSHYPLSYVITAAGPDRPGIVHDIASAVHTLGCNIEESRMTTLGTDFAVILRVASPPDVTVDSLTSSLRSTFGSSFIISARPTSTVPTPTPTTSSLLSVSIEGPDQAGVVKAFTEVFSKVGAAVMELDTDTSSAPFAGYKMFTLSCRVAVPMEEGSMMKVSQGLEEFEEKWGFDVVIDEEGPQEEEGEEAEEQAQPAEGEDAQQQTQQTREDDKDKAHKTSL